MAPAAGDVPANVSGSAKLTNWNKSIFFTAAKLVYPEDVADVQAVCSSCLQRTHQQCQMLRASQYVQTSISMCDVYVPYAR